MLHLPSYGCEEIVDMAHRQVIFASAAREKILRGSAQLADAVRVTLGPKSKGSTVPDMAM
jgi:chaperonin GroEL (HSP60 family)